jgi:hypothetical protein
MAFINQGRHIGTVGISFGSVMMMSFNIKIQGNIPGPNGTNPQQIPYHGTPGSSQLIERTLTSLPDFQVGETITGSINSYTATISKLVESGTSEFATCVGGGAGGGGEQAGYGGGSGGGGASNNWGASGGGGSTTGQGNNGGNGGDRNSGSGAGGGGGGAGAAGGGGGGNSAGAGGNGLANFYRDGNTSGTTVGTHIFAGGGGTAGGNTSPSFSAGGSGGGGSGYSAVGTINTGSGGGASGSVPGNGGSGVVVVRYDTSQSGFSLSGGTTDTYTTGAVNYQSHTFLTTANLSVSGTGNIDTMIISGGGGGGTTGNSNSEGGWWGGGGGAGGMDVNTSTQIVSGIYAVEVGAGGVGSSANDTRTGNLSWITPRRQLILTNPTGDYVAGEVVTGGTSGATGDIISYTP